MEGLQIITLANVHQTILTFISENDVKIEEYEHMKECILRMIRERYIFNMGRDRLRDSMEDLTYILNPEDEINKDRVNKGLEYEYSDDEISDDDDEEVDEMDMMNFLKTMGQMRGMPTPQREGAGTPDDPESVGSPVAVEPVADEPVAAEESEPVAAEESEPVAAEESEPVVAEESEPVAVEKDGGPPVESLEKDGGAE